MAITTYAELQTAVANWLDRSDLTDRIQEFISLAEVKLNRKLKLQTMETSETATVTAQTFDLTGLATRWRTVRNVYLDKDTDRPLEYLTPDSFHQKYLGSVSGEPLAYTIEGNNMVFGPSPDATYTAKILYKGSIPALSDANTTNEFLDYHTDALMYGALMESAPFLYDDARLKTWGQMYGIAVGEINQEEHDKKHPTGSLMPRVRSAP